MVCSTTEPGGEGGRLDWPAGGTFGPLKLRHSRGSHDAQVPTIFALSPLSHRAIRADRTDNRTALHVFPLGHVRPGCPCPTAASLRTEAWDHPGDSPPVAMIVRRLREGEGKLETK